MKNIAFILGCIVYIAIVSSCATQKSNFNSGQLLSVNDTPNTDNQNALDATYNNQLSQNIEIPDLKNQQIDQKHAKTFSKKSVTSSYKTIAQQIVTVASIAHASPLHSIFSPALYSGAHKASQGRGLIWVIGFIILIIAAIAFIVGLFSINLGTIIGAIILGALGILLIILSSFV